MPCVCTSCGIGRGVVGLCGVHPADEHMATETSRGQMDRSPAHSSLGVSFRTPTPSTSPPALPVPPTAPPFPFRRLVISRENADEKNVKICQEMRRVPKPGENACNIISSNNKTCRVHGRERQRRNPQAKVTGTGEAMYDQRLFNQEGGMGHGLTSDDAYNLYDKQLFADRAATGLHRAKAAADDEDGGPPPAPLRPLTFPSEHSSTLARYVRHCEHDRSTTSFAFRSHIMQVAGIGSGRFAGRLADPPCVRQPHLFWQCAAGGSRGHAMLPRRLSSGCRRCYRPGSFTNGGHLT